LQSAVVEKAHRQLDLVVVSDLTFHLVIAINSFITDFLHTRFAIGRLMLVVHHRMLSFNFISSKIQIYLEVEFHELRFVYITITRTNN
jgi:hypothetical protein